MNVTEKKHSRKIQRGVKIQGRWHRNEYEVIRKLGAGAIGSVYLVQIAGRYAALKMSDQAIAMTSEVNVLKALNQVQDKRIGPYLLDVDDWQLTPSESYAFYVMEYIQGRALTTFIREKGTHYIGIVLVHLLHELEKLHTQQFIFGDLKIENIIITENPLAVRLIDVGGVTKQGRAIKEFTEFNDRGYWGLGSRKAEETYDLFAVTMVCLNVFYPQRFTRIAGDNQQYIQSQLSNINVLSPYRHILTRMLRGKYHHTKEAKTALIPVVKRQSEKKYIPKRRIDRRLYPVRFWLETVTLGILVMVYYVLGLLIF